MVRSDYFTKHETRSLTHSYSAVYKENLLNDGVSKVNKCVSKFLLDKTDECSWRGNILVRKGNKVRNSVDKDMTIHDMKYAVEFLQDYTVRRGLWQATS